MKTAADYGNACTHGDPARPHDSNLCPSCAELYARQQVEAHKCPREHAGLERLMMNMAEGKTGLPDPDYGQDVAAIAFFHEGIVKQQVEAFRERAMSALCSACARGEEALAHPLLGWAHRYTGGGMFHCDAAGIRALTP